MALKSYPVRLTAEEMAYLRSLAPKSLDRDYMVLTYLILKAYGGKPQATKRFFWSRTQSELPTYSAKYASKAVKALTALGGQATSREVQLHTGLSYSKVYRQLTRGVEKGQVVKRGRAQWALIP